MERQNLDTGLTFFIRKKLEHSVSLKEITEMLLHAGFSSKKIDEAILQVRSTPEGTHQEEAASNGFLPLLKKKEVALNETLSVTPSSSMFSGRLRRRDFILGFLFFFGMGVMGLAFILGLFSFIFPQFIMFVDNVTDPQYSGLWLLALPILFAPVTIVILSLIHRRLHDLGFSGWLSLGFISFFISPINGILNPYGLAAFQLMMAVIFVILISVKGEKMANIHGAIPTMTGSLFNRIFKI